MTVVNESIIKFRSRNGALLSIVLLHPKWQANNLYYLLYFLLYFEYFLCKETDSGGAGHGRISLIFSTVTEAMRPGLFFSD